MACFTKAIVASSARRAMLCIAGVVLLFCAASAQADKPDVVVLVNPAVPRWLDLLKEHQDKSPIHVVTTERQRGFQTPANVRYELGTSLSAVKDWRYGFVLGTLSPRALRRNELPPNWTRAALNYSFFFNSGKKGPTLVLKNALIADLPPNKGADQFIRTLFPNMIEPDLSASFAPKIYALGNGKPMLRLPGITMETAFPVRLSKGANGEMVEFPLDNRLEFAVLVRLKVGALGKNWLGQWTWWGDRTMDITSRANPFMLKAGEKHTLSVDIDDLNGVSPDGVVLSARIFDPDVAAYVK